MTEEKFEEIIEQGGEKFEIAVEKAAQKFDEAMESSMKHRSVRILAKSISYGGAIGLIIASAKLKEGYHPIVANICFMTGSVGVVANLMLSITMRKK